MKKIALVSLIVIISFGVSVLPVIAQPKSKENDAPHELSVTNLTVFVSSAYSMNSGVSGKTSSLNAKSLFRSTLPGGSIISRRTNADSSENNFAMPLGVITFKGLPTEDVDVLLEFKGRNLAHWIPARKLSGRLYWRSLNLTKSDKTSLRVDEKSWLNTLRQPNALTVELLEKSAKALFYDLEVIHQPDLKLEKSPEGYKVSNGSDYPVHDVVIFEPMKGKKGWKIAYSKVIPSGKKKKAAGSGKPKKEKALEKKKPKAKPAKKSAVASLIKNVFSVPSAAKKAIVKVEPKKEVGPPLDKYDVNYLGDKRDSSSRLLITWQEKNPQLGLSESELKYVFSVLEKHAFLEDQATVVYRFDDEYLDKLLPLEITPAPDRLKRVSIVILQDADPRQRSEIQNLIAQLGNDSWVKRESAYDKLKETGLAAREQLQKAVKNSDLEIASRAERLLEELATTK